jgi:hypothetical protein
MIEYLPRMYNVLDLSPIPQKGRRRRGGGRGGGGRGGGEEEGGGGGEESFFVIVIISWALVAQACNPRYS